MIARIAENLVAVFATGAGLFVAVIVIVFLWSAMPNGSPEHLAFMRRLIRLVFFGTLAATAVAVTLMIYGRPWTGATIGGAPAIVWPVMIMVLAHLEA